MFKKLKNKIFLLKRKIKHFYQKRTRGFSDDETWSLYTNIAKYTLPRLKRLREINFGVPCDVYTEKTWNKILDDMIFAINFAANHDDMDVSSLTKKDCKRINRGLNLFGKYFMDLWW